MTNGPHESRRQRRGGRPLRRRGPLGVGSWSLVVLLALALAVTGVLAYQAYDAGQAHEEVVRQAVDDVAQAAAWQVVDRGRTNVRLRLQTTVEALFSEAALRPGVPPSLAEFQAALEGFEGCVCPEDEERVEIPIGDADGAFRLLMPDRAGSGWDGSGGEEEGADREVAEALEASGGAFGPSTRRWLADTLRAREESVGDEDSPRAADPPPVGVLFPPAELDLSGDAPEPIVHVRIGSASEGVVYGFRLDAEALGRETFRPLVTAEDLLPRSITGGVPSDSLFRVEIRGGGRTLVKPGDGGDGDEPPVPVVASATESLPDWLGGGEVVVEVPEERAEAVALGGVPSSRLPLILVLVLLTGGLLVLAVVLLRREHQLARLRSDFVTGVTHELRTPLSQIRMFAELLGKGALGSPEDRDRAVSVIDQESRRLDNLVDNVLGFARMSGAARAVAPEPVAMDDLLKEVMERFQPLARGSGARLELEVEPDLAAVADREAVHRIILNLLDNAAKYGSSGQTIRVEGTRVGPWVRVRVDDEGPGVPPSERDRLWEPYERLERVGTGTGIGLTLVSRLVEAHGGEVEVGDAPGGGARFEVRLPAAATGNEDGRDSVPASQRRNGVPRGKADAHRRPAPAGPERR